MSAETIVVWEQTPYWAPELQRELQPAGVRVLACRNESELAQLLADSPGQGVIVGQRAERLPLPQLRRWVNEGIRLHVVLSERDEAQRWFFAELGVATVLDFDEARRWLVSVCQKVIEQRQGKIVSRARQDR